MKKEALAQVFSFEISKARVILYNLLHIYYIFYVLEILLLMFYGQKFTQHIFDQV